MVRDLKVMTFNIRHGLGMDGVIDLERIAGVVEKAHADLVGLNEVDRRTRRCGGVDQPAELARLLGMEYTYSPSIPYQGGQYGNAILSRWPIRTAAVHALPQLANEARSLLHAEIEWEGRVIHFLVTHLGLGVKEQRAQLDAIARLVDKLEGPKLLAGDLNFDVARHGLMEDVSISLSDAGAASAANTFPSDAPTKRIDYVFVSDEFAVREPFKPIATMASDHLPLVGTVGLHPES